VGPERNARVVGFEELRAIHARQPQMVTQSASCIKTVYSRALVLENPAPDVDLALPFSPSPEGLGDAERLQTGDALGESSWGSSQISGESFHSRATRSMRGIRPSSIGSSPTLFAYLTGSESALRKVVR
jgi:hypothetical protein